MNATFYILLGFLVGIAIMCAMVIAVSVKDSPIVKENKDDNKDPEKLVYKKPAKDSYTYDSSGRKRKVVNVRYRDS